MKKRLDGRGAMALAGLVFALVFSLAPVARASGKGSMEIGVGVHYSWPAMDVADFEPDLKYGLVFHYWLNDTTTVLVGFDQMSYRVPFEVDGADEDFLFNTNILYVGFRYRPELDFVFKPYFELGLGYQTWRTGSTPDFLDHRDGGSIGYFGGLGLDYEILHAVTAGLNLRYYYMVMQERIETEAVTIGPGAYKVLRDPMEDAGFATVGLEITWKFR